MFAHVAVRRLDRCFAQTSFLAEQLLPPPADSTHKFRIIYNISQASFDVVGNIYHSEYAYVNNLNTFYFEIKIREIFCAETADDGTAHPQQL